jgi:hypothetical protein
MLYVQYKLPLDSKGAAYTCCCTCWSLTMVSIHDANNTARMGHSHI